MGMPQPDIRAGHIDVNQTTANVINATKNLNDSIQNGVNSTSQTLQAWQNRDFKAREAHKQRQHDEWKHKDAMKAHVGIENRKMENQLLENKITNATSRANNEATNQTQKDITEYNAHLPFNIYGATNGLSQRELYRHEIGDDGKPYRVVTFRGPGGMNVYTANLDVASGLHKSFFERGEEPQKDRNEPTRQ